MDSLPTPAVALSALEVAETCPKTPALVVARTRCGKAGCRCNRGELHPTRYLRWREGGRHRRRYVRQADVAAVEAVLTRRRSERTAARLQRIGDAQLIRMLEARYRLLADLYGENV